MEKIDHALQKIMSNFWIHNKQNFDEESLRHFARKLKFPYDQWAIAELMSRREKKED